MSNYGVIAIIYTTKQQEINREFRRELNYYYTLS